MQKTGKDVLFPELSYLITGLLFKVHNELGRYSKEKQYCEAFESLLKGSGINYEREKPLEVALIENKRTNIADFVIEEKIVLEFKAKPFIEKEDYNQTQRYVRPK